jgi:AraC family transcriptional regulator of adaptative response/methylated-DNA-[protein]-cysteine methyltransferase
MATDAILSEEAMNRTSQPAALKIDDRQMNDRRINTRHTDERRWQAVLARDSKQDGAFVFGVSSTGVFCRPSCPAKRPRRENVTFFLHALEAEQAGYRACLRCRPKAVDGNP